MQSIGRLKFGSIDALRWPWAQSPPPQMGPAESKVAADVQESYGWILHPAIDYFLVCGGFFWIFAAIYATGLVHVIPGLNNLSPATLNNLNFAFFLVFVVPHGAATWVRVYDVPATRKASGIKIALLALVCLLLLIIGCTSNFWASVMARMVLCFSFQHGLGQAYGIGLIYCYKRKFFLSKFEKGVLFSIIQAGILRGVAGILGEPVGLLANVTLVPIFPAFPKWVNPACDVILALSVLAFFIVLVRKFIVEKRLMPLPAILTIATGVFIYAVVIPHVAQVGGAFILLYYTGHGLFHTPQYLAVTTSVHLKHRGLPKSVPFSKIYSQLWSWSAIKYYLAVYSLAWMYMLSSVWVGPAFKQIGLNPHPELWFLVWISCTNLHHYWSDAMVWKLKDKDNLKLLIN